MVTQKLDVLMAFFPVRSKRVSASRAGYFPDVPTGSQNDITGTCSIVAVVWEGLLLRTYERGDRQSFELHRKSMKAGHASFRSVFAHAGMARVVEPDVI